jgi:hypothetical protein
MKRFFQIQPVVPKNNIHAAKVGYSDGFAGYSTQGRYSTNLTFVLWN